MTTSSDPCGEAALLDFVRGTCLALPGAAERVSHGSPVFYTKKVFVWWRAYVRGDTKKTISTALCISVDDAERQALLESGQAFEPAYLWSWGWVAVDLADGQTSLAEAAELIETSYRNTASKKLIKELDERS